jgi:uncharacterized protein YcbX
VFVVVRVFMVGPVLAVVPVALAGVVVVPVLALVPVALAAVVVVPVGVGVVIGVPVFMHVALSAAVSGTDVATVLVAPAPIPGVLMGRGAARAAVVGRMSVVVFVRRVAVVTVSAVVALMGAVVRIRVVGRVSSTVVARMGVDGSGRFVVVPADQVRITTTTVVVVVPLTVLMFTGHDLDYRRFVVPRCASLSGMRVASLHTYPIKSGYRVDTAAAEVEPWGFAGDRRWVIVDADGKALTQRVLQTMVRLRPEYTEKGLLIKAAGVEDLDLTAPTGDVLELVTVWSDVVAASPAGPLADEWVSSVVERDVRLLYLDDPTRRPVDPEYAAPEDRVSFADGYPVLLATEGSLNALNDWLVEDGEDPVSMTRFRPNVVVSGSPAWAEDDWIGRRMRIGEVTFRVLKSCSRCVLTTIDPETGEKGRQPLKTLGRRRQFDDGLLFAVNLVPDNRGTVCVDDPVTVL